MYQIPISFKKITNPHEIKFHNSYIYVKEFFTDHKMPMENLSIKSADGGGGVLVIALLIIEGPACLPHTICPAIPDSTPSVGGKANHL